MFYTKKGDAGYTTLDSEKELPKSCMQCEVLGAFDELNAFLGLCKVKSDAHNFCLKNGQSCSMLIQSLQNNLFVIQAELAQASKTITYEDVHALERIIDEIAQELLPINHFCIPGGCELAVFFDIARTIARRAERELIRALEHGTITVSDATQSYINRLSSLLFALARFANYTMAIPEQQPTY